LSSSNDFKRLQQSSSSSNQDNTDNEAIDIEQDDRLYRIRIPRATGIEWGTDLSFSFVYVRDLDPSGPAATSGKINKGDQICELRPVVESKDGEVVPLIGAPFDAVMNAFATLDKDVKRVELVFFKGSKDELKALCEGKGPCVDEDDTITITVIQNNKTTHSIRAEKGANVRQTLVDNGINVYQSLTRWTNCKGKQLCGTCIVNMTEGSLDTNRKSMDEASTLRENPDSYRLSCVTFAYGDVTVETFPPIEASQWTR
jgi:ferredoxin